jgi:hypothetical protein
MEGSMECLALSKYKGEDAMKSIFISAIAVDVFSSGHRVKEINELFHFIANADEKPYLRKGDDYYDTILLTTEEVEDNEVDKLLQAHNNACEVANEISSGYSASGTISGDDLKTHYGDQYEVEGLSRVSYEEGQVKFYLDDDDDIEWVVIDAE